MDLKFATWLRTYAIEHNDGVEHGAYAKLGREIGVKPTTLRSILGRKGRTKDGLYQQSPVWRGVRPLILVGIPPWATKMGDQKII